MSCPDWRELAALREVAAPDLPAWAEARRHAAQCEGCRKEALAADPLLLFARLPERRVTPGEILDMQAAVTALVRAGRVAGSSPAGSDTSDSSEHLGGGSAAGGVRRSVRFSFMRLAAALGICSLLALSGAPRPRSPRVGTLDGGAVLAAQGASAEEAQSYGSVVEELDRPGARIYELPQSGMAVVMIVDASLDV